MTPPNQSFLKIVGVMMSLSWLGAWSEDKAYGQDEPQVQREQTSSRARAYHFGVGAAKPFSIGNQYNHYDKLFGAPELYPEVWGEYYFLHFVGFNLGFRSKLAYYSDKGNPARNVGTTNFPLETDLTDDQVDTSQDSHLTLIPIETSLALSYSPWASRPIVVQGWYGLNWVFVENTMSPKTDASSAGNSEVFLNQGWNREATYGLAMSFSLSWLDQKAAYSLEVFGITNMYVTPFFESVTGQQTSYGVFDRETFGVMFTFETDRPI